MSTEERNWAMRIIDESSLQNEVDEFREELRKIREKYPLTPAEIVKANRLETVKAARRIIEEEETD